MPLVECKDCGKQVSDKAAACINCGLPMGTPKPLRLESTYASATKHGFPAFVSAVVPGMGQIIKGDLRKGIGLLLLTLLAMGGGVMTGNVMTLIFWLPIAVWAVYDAYNTNLDKPENYTAETAQAGLNLFKFLGWSLAFLGLMGVSLVALMMIVFFVPGINVSNIIQLLPLAAILAAAILALTGC